MIPAIVDPVGGRRRTPEANRDSRNSPAVIINLFRDRVGKVLDLSLTAGNVNAKQTFRRLGKSMKTEQIIAKIDLTALLEKVKRVGKVICTPDELQALVQEYEALAAEVKRLTAPVDMLLFCPKCFEQHVDKAEPDICQDCGHTKDAHGFKSGCGTHKMDCQCDVFTAWLNPPHKSHRCTECNHVWRPADVPTNGVQKLETSGRADGSARPVAFANGKDFDDSVATATKRLTDENARLREGLERTMLRLSTMRTMRKVDYEFVTEPARKILEGE